MKMFFNILAPMVLGIVLSASAHAEETQLASLETISPAVAALIAPVSAEQLPVTVDGAYDVAAGKLGSCSCNLRDNFTSGGVSCQTLRENGTCPTIFKGVGSDTASCQANARAAAAPACRGCLAHCKFYGASK